MQVLAVEAVVPEWERSVVCIGTFDGVHIGHQEVIRTAVERARREGLPCILATFDRNPAALLAPDKCPPTIASLDSNIKRFEELGVDITTVFTFDRPLSELHAGDFFERFLMKALRAAVLVVGHDFTFGKDREGNATWLAKHVETEVVPPFLHDGARVSSGWIRQAIASGDVQLAATLLGRPFEIPAVVVHGQRLGRTLGYPTANLARSFNQVTPSDGVYGGTCQTPYGHFPAAISVGVRPTIDAKRTIEAFLLDYPGEDLYGRSLRLLFKDRLRDQTKFETLEDLKIQIETDVADVSRVNYM